MENRRAEMIHPQSLEVITSDLFFLHAIPVGDDYLCNGYETPEWIANYLFPNEKCVLGIFLGTRFPQYPYFAYFMDFENFKFYSNSTVFSYHFRHYQSEFFTILWETLREAAATTGNYSSVIAKNMTVVAYEKNLGHAMFNEMTGLCLLDSFDGCAKLNSVHIGDHDFFDLRFFFERRNKEIFSVNDSTAMFDKIQRGFCFKYNHHFISDKVVFFTRMRILRDYTIAATISDDLLDYYPLFNITLRLGRRKMKNQTRTMVRMIQLLSKRFPNAYFFLDGFCRLSSSESNNVFFSNDLLTKYHHLASSIIEQTGLSTIKNLIGMEMHQLLPYYDICNYAIYQLGSICCVSAWLCDVPGIQFSSKPHIEIYNGIDRNIKMNMPNMPNMIYFKNSIVYEDDSFTIDPDIVVQSIDEKNFRR